MFSLAGACSVVRCRVFFPCSCFAAAALLHIFIRRASNQRRQTRRVFSIQHTNHNLSTRRRLTVDGLGLRQHHCVGSGLDCAWLPRYHHTVSRSAAVFAMELQPEVRTHIRVFITHKFFDCVLVFCCNNVLRFCLDMDSSGYFLNWALERPFECFGSHNSWSLVRCARFSIAPFVYFRLCAVTRSLLTPPSSSSGVFFFLFASIHTHACTLSHMHIAVVSIPPSLATSRPR